MIKGIYEPSTATIIINGIKLNVFPLRSEIRQGDLFALTIPIHYCTRSSRKCNKASKRNEKHPDWEELKYFICSQH